MAFAAHHLYNHTASNLSSVIFSCRVLLHPVCESPLSLPLIPTMTTTMMTTWFPRHQQQRRPRCVYVASGIGRGVVPPSFRPPPRRRWCRCRRLSPACECRRIGVIVIADVPRRSAHIPVAQSWQEWLSSSSLSSLSAVERRWLLLPPAAAVA
jgi:hypothetical protein